MNKEEFPEDYYEQLAFIIDKLEKIADGIRQLERRVRFAQISARKKNSADYISGWNDAIKHVSNVISDGI